MKDTSLVIGVTSWIVVGWAGVLVPTSEHSPKDEVSFTAFIQPLLDSELDGNPGMHFHQKSG